MYIYVCVWVCVYVCNYTYIKRKIKIIIGEYWHVCNLSIISTYSIKPSALAICRMLQTFITLVVARSLMCTAKGPQTILGFIMSFAHEHTIMYIQILSVWLCFCTALCSGLWNGPSSFSFLLMFHYIFFSLYNTLV